MRLPTPSTRTPATLMRALAMCGCVGMAMPAPALDGTEPARLKPVARPTTAAARAAAATKPRSETAAKSPLVAAPAGSASRQREGSAMGSRYLMPYAASLGSRVTVTTIRAPSDATGAMLRIEVPVSAPLADTALGSDKLRLAAKASDFRVDLGTYGTLSRTGAPRLDAAGRLILTPDAAEMQALRDPAGRSRTVPQVNVGLNVRF